MPFKLNQSVMDENHRRAHAPEIQYMELLRERGLLFEIENVLIDAEQLVLRSFQCDSAYCLRCSGDGNARQYKGSCCTDLQVDITPNEAETLRELGRIASERLTLTPGDPMSTIVKRLKGDFTERVERGDLTLRHLSSGRCALSWVTPGGVLRCSINTLCQRLDLPLIQYKPEPCFLFPLHYVMHEPGRYFMTLVCEENHRYIGADKITSKMRCLHRPQAGSPPAYIFLRGEIGHCFGPELWDRLDAAARPLLEREGLASSLAPSVPTPGAEAVG